MELTLDASGCCSTGVQNKPTAIQYLHRAHEANRLAILEQRLSVGGYLIKNLRFADDTTFLAKGEEDIKV